MKFYIRVILTIVMDLMFLGIIVTGGYLLFRLGVEYGKIEHQQVKPAAR